MAKPKPIYIDEVTPPFRRRFWVYDEMCPEDRRDKSGGVRPVFGVKEASKIFFGRGPDWLRWRMRTSEERPDGGLYLDGKPLQIKRTPAGAKHFSLADIERIAHGLVQEQAIATEVLAETIRIVLGIARLYGYDLESNFTPSEDGT